MNSRKNSSTEELRADIVVIGGGGGGLAAAVAAAEKGVKKIIVLEARRVLGGNAVFPAGIFAVESPLQKRLGIDAQKDDFFKKAMCYSHWKADPRLIRALVDKSGDTIRWLEEKGVEFVRLTGFYPQQVPVFHCAREYPGRIGAVVVRALVKDCEDRGVHLLYQIKAKKLLTNGKGKVVGVLAETKDKEIKITAKSVIIATGGFAGNKELLKKYFPSYDEKEFHRAGILHKGDGLRMATEIGAATDGMAVLEMGGPHFPWSSNLSPFVGRPNTLWVNKKGERFTDETVTFLPSDSANIIYRQPEKASYTIFDERIKQVIIEKELELRRKLAISNGSWATRVDRELRLQVDKGRVKISDSWDEIAKWIGAAPRALEDTIGEYNSFCEQGHDLVFAKAQRYLLPLRTPPYYAIRCCLSLETTKGGIKINHHMEVLNRQDSPIYGLYAAGDDTGGTDSDTYNFELPGHSFGFAINSGRIAGENAAKYVLGR